MLVLARGVGEWVYLDVPACPAGCCPARRLKVGVSDMRPKAVRLAFVAPDEVIILRQEIDAAGPPPPASIPESRS